MDTCALAFSLHAILNIQFRKMTEKVQIRGKDVWIVVEPVVIHPQNNKMIPTEYFVAYYNEQEPADDPGTMFLESNKKPRLFTSPVEALEYACEHFKEDS